MEPLCTKPLSLSRNDSTLKSKHKYENSDTDIESLEKVNKSSMLNVHNDSSLLQKSKSSKRCRERYEVVYRSLLRRFRKFFNQDFDKATRYKSLKRYRTNTYFIECVSKYVKKLFEERYSQKLVFSLSYLIYPNILIKNVDELKKPYPGLTRFLSKQRKDRMQINDILYDFTFTKMKLLFTNKEYSYFFKYFVENDQGKFKNDELYASQEMLNL
jgi:hypothetical protein